MSRAPRIPDGSWVQHRRGDDWFGLDVGTDESDYHLVPAGLPGILLGRVTGRKKGRPGQLVTVLWSGRQILCHLSDLERCGTV